MLISDTTNNTGLTMTQAMPADVTTCGIYAANSADESG